MNRRTSTQKNLQELTLVAAGKLRLPQAQLDIKKLLKVPTGTVKESKAIQAIVSEKKRAH